ncbi:hypothetical protein H8959_019538, partial [Pygathrix nigripes]
MERRRSIRQEGFLASLSPHLSIAGLPGLLPTWACKAAPGRGGAVEDQPGPARSAVHAERCPRAGHCGGRAPKPSLGRPRARSDPVRPVLPPALQVLSFGADHDAEQEAAAAGPVTGGLVTSSPVTGSQLLTWVLSVKPGWLPQQTALRSQLLTGLGAKQATVDPQSVPLFVDSILVIGSLFSAEKLGSPGAALLHACMPFLSIGAEPSHTAKGKTFSQIPVLVVLLRSKCNLKKAEGTHGFSRLPRFLFAPSVLP